MPGEGGGQAHEASGGAGEEDLGAVVGELVGEGGCDLFDRDAAGVGEIAAELEERVVGRVERGDFGEDRARQGAVLDGGERDEDHVPNGSEAPSPDGREGASAAMTPWRRMTSWRRRPGGTGRPGGDGQTLTPKSWAMPVRPEA